MKLVGWTPLHSAVYWNAYHIVDYFLKHAGADVNAQTSGGQTPLHLAAQQSDIRETLLLLLTHPRVDFTLRNEQHETSHEMALRSCKYNALYEIADDALNIL